VVIGLCNDLNNGDSVDSVMLCVGVPGCAKDICEVGSEGPIFDREGTKTGVVLSWGYGCIRENFPGVYSHVSGTKDWIDATICELSSSYPASYGGRLTGTWETIDTPR
jgi:secreted trypsin-like serine protease